MTVQIALCDDEIAENNKTERLLSAYEQKHTGTEFMIECFENANELLHMVRERNYSPDLIFMDIYMPGETGELLDAFDVGAFQYLPKPFCADKLFSLLDRFLKEKEEREQCIYMADGTKVLQNLTMAKIYEMCSPCEKLVKVGASYIVHLEHIDSLSAQEARLDNGKTSIRKEELLIGIREFAENLKLYGEECAVQILNCERFLTVTAGIVYDIFEAVIEKGIDKVSAILFCLKMQDNSLLLTIGADCREDLTVLADTLPKLTVWQDEDGLWYLNRVFEQGGIAP